MSGMSAHRRSPSPMSGPHRLAGERLGTPRLRVEDRDRQIRHVPRDRPPLGGQDRAGDDDDQVHVAPDAPVPQGIEPAAADPDEILPRPGNTMGSVSHRGIDATRIRPLEDGRTQGSHGHSGPPPRWRARPVMLKGGPLRMVVRIAGMEKLSSTRPFSISSSRDRTSAGSSRRSEASMKPHASRPR